MMQWNINNADTIYEPGKVLKLDDGNFKVVKVTSSVLAVERYYWFDSLYDWIKDKVNSWKQT